MQDVHHDAIYRHELWHWWYRVRRELIHDLFNIYYPGRHDLVIADIGSGAAALTKELERYGHVIGIDPSEKATEFARSRGVSDMHIGSAEHTGLPDASCDIVTCLDVLEHLENDMLGIDEIRRILKPGGTAIIFVPAFMFLWGGIDISSNHYRRYRLPNLVAKLEKAGLTVIKRSYFNFFLMPPIAIVRFVERLTSLYPASEVNIGNELVNTICYRIFSLERKILRRMNFPFGVSALAVVRKNGD